VGAGTPGDVLAALRRRLPHADIILTLGAEGARHAGPGGAHEARPPRVQPVDTTGAGDTFIGFLLAALLRGDAMDRALPYACRAAALSTTRPGAAASIPTHAEVEAFGAA
jgi:ribokinase